MDEPPGSRGPDAAAATGSPALAGEFVNNRVASGGLAGRRRPRRGRRLARVRSERAPANRERGHRRQRRWEAAEPAAAGAEREGRSGRGRMFPARGALGGPAEHGGGRVASCGLCAAPQALSAGTGLCLASRLRGDDLGAPGRRRARAGRRGARARTRRSEVKGRT